MRPFRRSGLRPSLTRSGCGAGSGRRQPRGSSRSTATRNRPPNPPRPRRPRATPLLLELLVDPLAVRAHRRTGLGRLGHWKDLAAQRDNVATHDRALGDLVLLDVMEELRGVAVGSVVDAFVGVGALDGLGFHGFIVPGNTSVRNRSVYRPLLVEQWVL